MFLMNFILTKGLLMFMSKGAEIDKNEPAQLNII